MGRTACTEPQCLYESALYLPLLNHNSLLAFLGLHAEKRKVSLCSIKNHALPSALVSEWSAFTLWTTHAPQRPESAVGSRMPFSRSPSPRTRHCSTQSIRPPWPSCNTQRHILLWVHRGLSKYADSRQLFMSGFLEATAVVTNFHGDKV
jgi:hypothetical protein